MSVSHHKPVRAEFVNDQTCRVRAAGLTACSSSPALSLCRLLVKHGFDPERPLLVFRGDILAVRIRTIHEGASLEVNSLGTDTTHGVARRRLDFFVSYPIGAMASWFWPR